MGDLKYKRIFKVLLIIFVILISGLMIYKIHYSYTGFIYNPHNNLGYIFVKNFNYPFPIHADEWTHLSQVVYILESKTLGFRNPYSSELIFHKDFELGFHLFLALFFKLTFLNPVLGYQFLPALFFILNAIFLFFFVKMLTKNYYIALFSILFFLAIPSNTNFLGNWFAVPLTFSIFFIYSFFICLLKFLETKKKIYLFFAILSYLFSLSYPIATVLITLISIFYLFFELRIYKELKKYKIPMIFIFLVLLLGLVFFAKYLSFLIFSRDWTPFQYNYSLIFFYGLIPSVLAVLGVYFVLHKKFNRIFILWPLICLLNLLSYRIIGFGLFIPYERTMYYFLLGLVPLASIGLFYLLKPAYTFMMRKFSSKYKKWLSLFVILILVFITFFFVFKGYYNIKEKDLSLVHLLDKQDYDALKFIEKTYGKGNIILADDLVSIGIYPISKNHVVSIQGSNLGYGDTEIQRLFFKSNCGDKEKIINQFEVDFVLSRFEIDCDFLKKIYNEEDYVYGIKK